MATYRFSAEIIGRGQGHSATAAAAYRAGERIVDDRTGEVHDYRRRSGVLHAEILAPAHAPAWARDRAQLWNAVEKAERRGDAQVSRQIVVSLPHELNEAQRRELVRDFVQREFVSRGMVADLAIHAPDRNSDARNHHAHILLTMRRIEGEGFGNKERGWNSEDLLRGWRHQWAQHQNRALERAGCSERVDHRSYEDQGIDRQATQHLGKDAHRREQRGQKSRIGDKNREVQARNAERAQRERDLKVIQLEIEREKRRLRDEQREKIKQDFAQRQPPPESRPTEPVSAQEAFNEVSPAPPRESDPDPPAEIWDREQEERDWQEKMIDAAIAHGEEEARRKRPVRGEESQGPPPPAAPPSEEEQRERLHAWAMAQRDALRHRHLDEERAHENTLGGWFGAKEREILIYYETAIGETRRDLRAIEERQGKPGLKGLMERLQNRDDAGRAEGLRLSLDNAQTRYEGARARIDLQKQEHRDKRAAQQAREREAQERQIAEAYSRGRIPEADNAPARPAVHQNPPRSGLDGRAAIRGEFQQAGAAVEPLERPATSPTGAQREGGLGRVFATEALNPELGSWIENQRRVLEQRQTAQRARLMRELDRDLFPAREAIEHAAQPRIGAALRDLKTLEDRRQAPGLAGRFARMQHPDDRERAEALHRELEEARAIRERALQDLERQKHHHERTRALRDQHAQEGAALDIEIARVVDSGRVPEIANDNRRTAGKSHEGPGRERNDVGRGGRSRGR